MYRRGVSALILNNANEFLLVNLKSFEDHFFAIPGGGVEKDESLEDAVYREMKEELNISKESLRFIGRSEHPLISTFQTAKKTKDGLEYVGSERNFFGFIFTGNNDEIKLQESEVRSYRWCVFSELNKYLLFENQLENTVEKIKDIFPLTKF